MNANSDRTRHGVRWQSAAATPLWVAGSAGKVAHASSVRVRGASLLPVSKHEARMLREPAGKDAAPQPKKVRQFATEEKPFTVRHATFTRTAAIARNHGRFAMTDE